MHFQGEDLIVINIEQVKAKGEVMISNDRINRFRESLRKEGVAHDLGLREFETLKYRYPHNITIQCQAITIKSTKTFDSIFEERKSEINTRLEFATKIWKNTK